MSTPAIQTNAAPGNLHLVLAFVNTADREEGKDQLGTPESLRLWLIENGLIDRGVPVSEEDRQRVLRAREAIRALMFANNASVPPDDAAAELNRAVGDIPLVVRFGPDGRAGLESTIPGVSGSLARLIDIIFTSIADGSWLRLKACRQETCQWAFFDHSKNRSGTWCSMAVCGNRQKTRSYRKRRGSAPHTAAAS